MYSYTTEKTRVSYKLPKSLLSDNRRDIQRRPWATSDVFELHTSPVLFFCSSSRPKLLKNRNSQNDGIFLLASPGPLFSHLTDSLSRVLRFTVNVLNG